jgi:hypothetical protein
MMKDKKSNDMPCSNFLLLLYIVLVLIVVAVKINKN